jgi:dienelactone hydrolase
VLPTIYHWTHAARPELGTAVSGTSNFGGTAPADVGVRGLGPFGTFDMAGNVKEWVANEHEGTGRRYLLGGAWNEPDYQFIYPDSRSPFDRSDTNGFRCARYGAAAPAATLSAPVAPAARDYARERPVDDATFRLYADRYAYDRTPLDARIVSTDDASPHWRREVVNVAAGYGGERMPIHLFLPKNVKPPYQMVLVFPGSGAIRTPDSSTIRDYADYIVMSGRALVYPVYKFTYERHDPKVTSSWPQPTRAYRSWMQQVVIDVRRALDYTETRPDMDLGKVAYYGVSWGARLAPLSLAIDTRFKVAVMLMGGFGASVPDPEVDPFHFVPRVRVPVLMLNGDQDFIFPLQTTQLPFFRLLGTPAADKKHVLYPGGHEITTTYRNQVVAEVVAWLDRYLGRVQ